jgi:hypothetical protein
LASTRSRQLVHRGAHRREHVGFHAVFDHELPGQADHEPRNVAVQRLREGRHGLGHRRGILLVVPRDDLQHQARIRRAPGEHADLIQ